MININANKLKKVLDDDPDLIIKTYLEDEDASILILRSGDLGDEDYRVSLEKQLNRRRWRGRLSRDIRAIWNIRRNK
jgi:hypothetical protein